MIAREPVFTDALSLHRLPRTPTSRLLSFVVIAFGAACSGRHEAATVRTSASDSVSAIGTNDSVQYAAPAGELADSFPAPARDVAEIVGPLWKPEGERDKDGEFARVAKIANIRAGMSVADIGAGDGYYVARLAPLVGASGRVYANDVMPEYVRTLRQRVAREALSNVQVVLGDAHDPRLPFASVDVWAN